MLYIKKCVFFIIFLVCNTINVSAMQFTTDPSESKESRLESLTSDLRYWQAQKIETQARINEKIPTLENDSFFTYIYNYFTLVYGPRIFKRKSAPPLSPHPGVAALGGILASAEIIFKTTAYLLFPISIPITTTYAIKHWWREENLKSKQNDIDRELGYLAIIEENIKQISQEIKLVKKLPNI
jgi:hypothetical protein